MIKLTVVYQLPDLPEDLPDEDPDGVLLPPEDLEGLELGLLEGLTLGVLLGLLDGVLAGLAAGWLLVGVCCAG